MWLDAEYGIRWIEIGQFFHETDMGQVVGTGDIVVPAV